MFRVSHVLVLSLGLALAGVASAETKRKIRIETTPPGAVVYLVEKEAGPVCEETPCTIDAPVGTTPVIIELKDHAPVFDNVTVPKKGKVTTAKFTLDPAVGKVIVREPVGAVVFVDEEEQGKAPLELEVSADAHHVVVKLKGKRIYDGYVEVAAGNETVIGSEEGGGESEDDEVPEEEEEKITKSTTPTKLVEPWLRGTVAVDIGFRSFTYNAGSNQRPEKEAGQILAGPVIELWPGRLAKVRALHGFSLLGRFQFGLNQQPVVAADLGPNTSTFWQSLEGTLRQQFVFAQKFGLELGLGYVRDQMQFSGTPGDIEKLPDVIYSVLRIGVRASMRLGKLEPYFAAEPRFVLSGGKLQNRYEAGTGASGYRIAGGALVNIGRITGRAEVSTTRYGWTFVNSDPEITMTESGTDAVIQVGFSAGYQF
ncbi:MAG: PEGA domain-containing protein [Kofleriaceae bacterium]|nr:PEGA domain-containing protein [Kofleriaceae bacterium]